MTPASSLNRFPRYQDRSVYKAMTGKEAKPFDKLKPPKHWEDTTLMPGLSHDAVVSYQRLPHLGESLTMKAFSLNAGDATSVNLPGMANYPPNSLKPTDARIELPGHLPQVIGDVQYLCMLADAERILGEIGGDSVEMENDLNGATIVYGNDPRRVWMIIRKGARLNAGLLLANQYAHGVGAPGHWDLTPLEPVWVSDVLDPGSTSNSMPEVDMPVNDVPAGATLVRSGLMMDLYLQTAESVAAAPGQLPAGFADWCARMEAGQKDISERLKKLGI